MIKIKKGIPLYDQCDDNGYWGKIFGSSFIPETLFQPLEDLSIAFEKLRKNKKFIKERDEMYAKFIGRPTPFLKLNNLSKYLGGAQIYAKHEAMANSQSHKLNNALLHCLIAKYTHKKVVVGDTGAGMAGSGLAMAAAATGLKAIIFQGEKDYLRQAPNSMRMRLLGAQIHVVKSGSRQLVDAVSESIRYYVANCDKVHLAVGSSVGPSIYTRICAYAQSVISKELKKQIKDEFGKIPKDLTLCAAVGGGSSSLGFWMHMIDSGCKLIGCEAGGPIKFKNKHAAPLTYGSKLGILHGAAQYVMQDKNFQIADTESVSAGLDYPGCSAIHSWLKQQKRATYVAPSDEATLEAFKLCSRLEGIQASLEPSHALAHVCKIAPKMKKTDKIITLICGNAMKDFSIIAERLGVKI